MNPPAALRILRARLRAEIAALQEQLGQRRTELAALSAVMPDARPIEPRLASPPAPAANTHSAPDDFGAQVQQQREAAGLTQQQFAERAGVALKTLGNVEQSRHAPTPSIRRRLTIALDAMNPTAQPPR